MREVERRVNGEMITMIGMGMFAICMIIWMSDGAIDGAIERYLQAVRDREWDIIFGGGGIVLGLVLVYAGILIAGG